ncbi:hypothetical protein LINGRAHAP2_LOCUS21560 [Linum grandiflorum]
MARKELEDLYSGIPDDSVNLTFQDMARVDPPIKIGSLNKIPSLDFNKGLEATTHLQGQAPLRLTQGEATVVVGSPRGSQHQHNVVMLDPVSYERGSPRGGHMNNSNALVMASPYQDRRQQTPANNYQYHGRGMTPPPPYSPNDFSRSSVGTPMYDMVGKGGGGRRPGIPHSNICTICSTYIYIFKNRCLAGVVGCCSRYPARVKQEELKWAEKGPRRSGERAYGSQHRNLKSGSSTPMMASPMTPSRNPPSYLMGSPYSPYSSSAHHLPL